MQSSSYAEVLGVPVAALGLVGFLGLLAGGARAAASGRGSARPRSRSRLSLFGVYLLYIQLVVIGAICQWCLATDVLTTAIAALALLRLRIVPIAAPAAPARPYPKRRPKRSAKRKPQRARTR